MKQCYGFILLLILGCALALPAQDYPGWTLDEITVEEGDFYSGGPASAYNIERDEFLVVWEDYRNSNWDIYGAFVSSDGSVVGEAFPICSDTSGQYTPHIDYNRIDEQYLVVWKDKRLDVGDIFGVLLDGDGKKLMPVTQKVQDDTSFVICDADTNQYHPRVAHNWIENTYLVVWADWRETYPDIYSKDIYAQRLDSDGGLLPPYDSPDTAVNFPIVKWDYEEYAPDVTFVSGAGDFTVNEWLVIWIQDEWDPLITASRVMAKRIDGMTGMWLNTFGEETGPPEQFSKPLAKSASMLGAQDELTITYNGVAYWWQQIIDFYCGSGHVKFFEHMRFHMLKGMAEEEEYPIPEAMIVWTDFRNSEMGMMDNPDIYCQRIAWFPDSTARRLELKWIPESDTTNATVALLDEQGNWPDTTFHWITWPNIPVCNRHDPQSYNGIGSSLNDQEYLIAWNDWRNGSDYWDLADIYGQRITINPADSALVFLDENGNPQQDRTTNIPIAVDTLADEGAHQYPSVSHGSYLNKYLISYNYYKEEAAGANSGLAQSMGHPTTDVKATVASSETPDNSVKPLPDDQLPSGFVVAQNYPNPFNPVTMIQFRIPSSSPVTVKVFDVLGREISTLLNQKLEAGSYEVIWDSKDASGAAVASGVYLFRIEAGDQMVSKKMVLMR